MLNYSTRGEIGASRQKTISDHTRSDVDSIGLYNRMYTVTSSRMILDKGEQFS